VFTERGIEFYVFPDELDFNTRPTTNGDMYYRSKGKTVSTKRMVQGNSRKGNYGVKVENMIT
jgi:hypothetical protein